MAKERLTKCRSCGETVAASATSCPHCGARLKGSHPVLGTVLTVIGILLLVGACRSMFETGPEKAGERSTETDSTTQELAQQPKQEQTVFYKGDVVNLNDVAVTLMQVTESSGSEFNKPTDGNVYVLCEFEIENNSQKDVAISSMLSFQAYHDDYAANLSVGAIAEKGNKNQLDGTVAAGKKFNGIVGYEFPEDWQKMEIKFKPNFWSGKDITFVYNRGN